MDVQKLQAFIEAVDAGSIAAAGVRMGYSTSSISRMIADLEAGCGVRLLERGKHGVTLTPDGERLLKRARRVVAECDGFFDEAASITGLERGHVRIGTISSIATHILPAAMAAFRRAHPGVDFELLIGDYEEIATWLAEGRVDMGSLHHPAPPEFESRVVARDQLVAVVPKDHPLAHVGAFPLSAFAEEPFIALERGGLSEVAGVFAATDLAIRPAFATWDDFAIMAMVEAGMGISILPELMIRRTDYRIAVVPLEVDAPRDIALAWRAGLLPAAASAFLQTLPSA